MNKNNCASLIAFFLLQTISINAFASESVSSFLVYYGSAPKLSPQSVPVLAGHDLIVVDRFRYREINENTWNAIKAASPSTKIVLYQLGPGVSAKTDSYVTSSLNNLGRYNNSRGSSDGSLNLDHPSWFLKNSSGQRVVGVRNSDHFALDYGNKQFVDYWSKHTLEDITSQEWRADGVFVDEVALCSTSFLKSKPTHVPAKYSNCESWNNNMIDFLSGVSSALQQNNQLVMANIGNSINDSVPAAWRELGQRNSAPDILAEEGAFAVSWGSNSDVRFWPVAQWKQQIDLPGSVNRHVAMNSHTDLGPGQQGVSHYGEKVSHSQIMRYVVGSYLLSRNANGNGPTTYLSFDDDRKSKNGSYKTLRSTDVYNKFDIGVPVAKYEIRSSDQNLYFRKYTKGYVYVNPTNKRISAIKAESGAEFSSEYDNARQDGVDWYFDLAPHDAAIIKANTGAIINSKQATPPIPPVLKAN